VIDPRNNIIDTQGKGDHCDNNRAKKHCSSIHLVPHPSLQKTLRSMPTFYIGRVAAAPQHVLFVDVCESFACADTQAKDSQTSIRNLRSQWLPKSNNQHFPPLVY
jgi:hypothetical protein